MPASYPASVKVWSPSDAGFQYPADLETIVFARHVTTIYDEVTAVQQILGTNPNVSIVWGTGAFNPTFTGWTTVKERMDNIERGLFRAITQYVSVNGASQILNTGASATTNVGLRIRAVASQTSNNLEIKNSSGTNIYTFGTTAGSFTGVIDGGTA